KSSCHVFLNSSRARTPAPNKPPSSTIALLAPVRIDPRALRRLSDARRVRERPDAGGVRAVAQPRPARRLHAGRRGAPTPRRAAAGPKGGAMSSATQQRMKRVVIHHFGGPEVLKVVDDDIPQPGPGEVRVRILAAGVSFSDALLRAGTYLGGPKPPFTPG